jgi:L-2-hydroxyglutarate oxidase
VKDYTIIGGGLVGMGTALALARQCPGSSISLLEKEKQVGNHQSTHNSGVLHAGLYYKPGSLKAKLAVEGIRSMSAFCLDNGVPHEICGKLVIATTPEEVARLRILLERGVQNGLQGLRWLKPEEFKEIEPHTAGLAAVHVSQEGIVDYRAVCDALHRRLTEAGVEVMTGCKVLRLHRETGGWILETNHGQRRSRSIVNCAGLHCDRVAESAGEQRTARIIPFRGEYYQLRPEATHLVKHLIYPVPDPVFPFLGVHYTRLVGGGIEAGPNAVLAYAREGYTKGTINLPDLADSLFYRGLWAFMRKHRAMAWDEVKRSYSKRLFCRSLQALVPELCEQDLAPGGAGVRAQAMLPDGTLVQDFHVIESPGALHVLNAPSPAATASLAIGEYLARRLVNVT